MTKKRILRQQFSLSICNQLSDLAKVSEFFNGLQKRKKISDKIAFSLNLACEELITNTITYGFPQGGEHTIQLWLWLEGEQVKIRIVDEGIPFNPLQKEQPELSLPIENRPIGGLGIHFVKQLMDELTYRRADGRNIVEMIKRKRMGEA